MPYPSIQTIKQIFPILLGIFCIILRYALPINSEIAYILPATDIAVIYYLYTYNYLGLRPIYILSILIDQLIGCPLGTSSIAFVISILAIIYIQGTISINDYYTNMAIYIPFAIFIILFRILSISIYNDIDSLDIYEIIAYITTTIFIYPILKNILDLTNAK